MTDVTIVHAIPGRVRLRIAEMRANPAMATEMRERLSRIAGACRVETNLVTGSVIVWFDTPAPVAADHLHALAETLPALDIDGGNGNGHTSDFRPDRQVAEFLRSVNSSVGTVTSGFDLKLLVPVALFALGVRSLIVSDRLPFPSWYDYVWFGLSTFVMMNGAAFNQAGPPSPVA